MSCGLQVVWVIPEKLGREQASARFGANSITADIIYLTLADRFGIAKVRVRVRELLSHSDNDPAHNITLVTNKPQPCVRIS